MSSIWFSVHSFVWSFILAFIWSSIWFSAYSFAWSQAREDPLMSRKTENVKNLVLLQCFRSHSAGPKPAQNRKIQKQNLHVFPWFFITRTQYANHVFEAAKPKNVKNPTPLPWFRNQSGAQIRKILRNTMVFFIILSMFSKPQNRNMQKTHNTCAVFSKPV